MAEDDDERRGRLTDQQLDELVTAYVDDVRAGVIHPQDWNARDTRWEVKHYLAEGPEPLRLLDAILDRDTGDGVITEDVGLGLLVGYLDDRRGLWAQLNERCRKDLRWAARRPNSNGPSSVLSP
ncbi:hypothetical protein V5H98_09735 [Georgenia sp. M64]|uniref:hypothetical protein n=1 Tax=Georgenia sp. M64 TaxID=3120520 RepID=UPI0030E58179